MKKKVLDLRASVYNLSVALFIAISGMMLISSCDTTTSVTHEEAWQAGQTIGRMIRGE